MSPAAAQVPPGESAPPFRLLWACCFVAALSQPLLDAFTSYGTQLLSPITKARFAVDAVPIVDMFYTPMLILTLLACFVVRKAKADPRRLTRIIGWAGLTLSSGYIAAGAVTSWQVSRSAARALGISRTHAYPLLGTIFAWRVTAEDDDAWYVARHNVLFSGPLEAGRFARVPKVANEWTRRAGELWEARTYRWFAMGQIRAAYRRADGGHVVELHDMRYSFPAGNPESLWPLRVTFDADGKLLGASRPRRRGFRFWQMAARIWSEMWAP